jgi:hypothetical protein
LCCRWLLTVRNGALYGYLFHIANRPTNLV